MKKQILIVGLMMISAITFGQKKEIKKAQKSIKAGNFSEAVTVLKQAEGLISNADKDLKIQFYIAKGEALLGDSGNDDFEKLIESAESFEKAINLNPKGKNAVDAQNGTQNIRVKLVNSAITDQKAKNYKRASKKLYTSYMVSKKDTSDLYFAAGNAVNAKEYENALTYYKKLLDLGYTGISKEYIATDIVSGDVVVFASEDDRNTKLLTKLYTNPKERMSESNKGEILRNVTLIYISQGKNDEAKAMMSEARKENPDDVSLMRAEADMAYNFGDMNTYKRIMEEIISTDPNNAELYYNLGVSSYKNGEKEAAMNYYKKALELKPDYTSALINTANLILSKEGAIIEEMNALGTSKADYDRYDELKEVKANIYRDAIPYLKKAADLRKDDASLLKVLKDIYSQVGMDAESKLIKARLEEIENKG